MLEVYERSFVSVHLYEMIDRLRCCGGFSAHLVMPILLSNTSLGVSCACGAAR